MAAYYLVEDSPNYVGAIHGLWTENFNALMQTAESIRTDTAQNKVDFLRMSHEQLGGFIRGLHGTAVATGRNLSKQSQFAEARSIIDVGGGSGGLAIALCQEHPQLQATVLDLPAVIPFAEEMVEEAGLADRITVGTVDIVNDPVEGDFDIAIARALFQVLSAEQCSRAAQHIGAGITRGGALFIIGFSVDDSRLSPAEAVGLNLIFMSMLDGGQAYTESEYRQWLSDAGFSEISREPYLMGNSLITARKT
jgi:ribosomal protein L11 methylase PrmA